VFIAVLNPRWYRPGPWMLLFDCRPSDAASEQDKPYRRVPTQGAT
jgi:hypothetical protein